MLELIGRYQIQEQIGEGAMADVYRAYDPHIDRALAVKVLKAEYRQDREYAVRFLREARAAGALSHPGIVTIFDVGEVDGYPFIVMELLEGAPLSEVLKQGAMSPAAVMSIGIQLADALAYAHAQGVVHRDIKPSNIVLSPDRKTLKLLDFGIARVTETGSLFEKESLHTQIGQVLGTPRYMSPEQALGRDMDGRGDIYSVGVILYELVTGRRAFPGTTAATLTAQIINTDPEPLAKAAPATPRGLQFIIGKAMAKQPSARFADGFRLADALRRELSANLTVVHEAARQRYLPLQLRLTLWLAAITTLVLAGAVGTVLIRQRNAMEEVALSAGNAVSAFVANNAALRAVDNATLPPEQQDWVPTEVFVKSASADPNVRHIIVVGAEGIVHAATDPALVGQPYRVVAGERVVARRDRVTISETRGGNSFRFVRPIMYAQRTVGRVDVALSQAELQSASRLSTLLLVMLAIVTLGTVALVSYVSARLLQSPIRRLRDALLQIAKGNLDFRISHHRRDEFGELFDGVNMVAQTMQERVNSVEALLLDTPLEPSTPPRRRADDRDAAPAAAAPQPVEPQDDLPVSPSPPDRPAFSPSPPIREAFVDEEEAHDLPEAYVPEDQSLPPEDDVAGLHGSPEPVDIDDAAVVPEPPSAAPVELPPEPEQPSRPWPSDDDEDRTLVGPEPNPYR